MSHGVVRREGLQTASITSASKPEVPSAPVSKCTCMPSSIELCVRGGGVRVRWEKVEMRWGKVGEGGGGVRDLVSSGEIW